MAAKLRLLIIEDDPTSAKLMQITLNRLGYEVVGIATNGMDAIELTQKTLPNLLLMDINLPGQIDGIETIRQIRKQFDLPVIYVTANTEDNTISEAKSTNPIGYLVKPFSREHLKTMVEMGIHKHKLENEIKKNKELLTVTLENVADGVMVVDSYGQILLKNDAALKILGMEEGQLANQLIFDIFPNLFNIIKSAGTSALTDTPQPELNHPIEVEWSSGNGYSLFIEQQITNIVNHENDPATSVITFRDVTARRLESDRLVRMNEELEERVESRTHELRIKNLELERENKIRVETERELKQALLKEKEMNQFHANIVTTVSHEFRTPLTTIQSSTELIERLLPRDQMSENINRHLRQILSSVTSLTTLLNDVLLIEKMGASKVEVHQESIDPEEFFQNITNEFKIGAGKNHLFNYEHNVFPTTIVSDPKLLSFIVNNLLSNAFKYSPHQSTVLLVVYIGENQLKITVIDKGIGISAASIQYLFNTFYRDPTVANIEGTGVGLSILKESLDLLNGSIEVDSKEGYGSTFMVTIPFRTGH